jgi:hypothetical protein
MQVDADKGIIKKTDNYDSQDKLISSNNNKEYEQIGNAWVLKKAENVFYTQTGEMKSEVEYNNIILNGGVSDEEFKIK